MGGAMHPRRLCHLRQQAITAAATLALLLVASASALSLLQLGGEAREPERKLAVWSGSGMVVRPRPEAVGPGSSPPTCRSKCGKCSPCKPVHVPIHPGLTLPLEYYPEAWRCKCGNKLFMP